MTQIYKPGDLIPLGNLIKAFILHWYNYCTNDRLHQSNARLRAWRKREALIRVTLNETSTLIPKFPGLDDIEIEA